MKKILFIVNPISGGKDKNKLISYLHSVADNTKYAVDVAVTEYIHHGYDIAKEALMEGSCDMIVAVGGDGSINDVVNAISRSEITFGILPVGSGNGLARFLNIPLDFKKAVDLIFNGEEHRIDTLEITSEKHPIPVVAASLVGVGFDALVAKDLSEQSTRGFQAYSKIVLHDYPNYKPKSYKIYLDSVEIRTKAFFITFCNSSQFGYNAIIAPNAVIDDGLMDISTVRKFSFFEVPQFAYLLFTKKILSSEYVDSIRAKQAVLTGNVDEWVNVDGEAYKMGSTLNIKVVPHSLKVIRGARYDDL